LGYIFFSKGFHREIITNAEMIGSIFAPLSVIGDPVGRGSVPFLLDSK